MRGESGCEVWRQVLEGEVMILYKGGYVKKDT